MLGTSVRATSEERARALPGDDLISSAIGSLTHAISIGAPAEEVWPWLAQMGAGRAGWYSYDALDNGGHRSAERILPEYQQIGVGTLMPALPRVLDGFKVLALDPPRCLVIGWGSAGGGQMTTWAFVLEPAAGGATRLIVRARGAPGYRLFGMPPGLSKRLVRFVHWVMQRRQLRGIKRRVERSRARGG